MNNELKMVRQARHPEQSRGNSGFSLMEILLAVGTLAIGMIFIGGTFIAGIHFSTIATERTIAAVAADEAFAKVKIFGGINTGWIFTLSTTDCNDFSQLVSVDANEFAYPSTPTDFADKQYFWSALCRRVSSDLNQRLVQVTVFVSRKVGSGTKYRNPADPLNSNVAVPFPMPVKVDVSAVPGAGNENKLTINLAGWELLVNDGYTIVENTTGHIYRVIKRYADAPNMIELDRDWQGGNSVWVIPPAVSGGRYPCIVVYQKEVRF